MPAEVVQEDTLEDLISPLKVYSDLKHGRYYHRKLASDNMLEQTIQSKQSTPANPQTTEEKKFKQLRLKPT